MTIDYTLVLKRIRIMPECNVKWILDCFTNDERLRGQMYESIVIMSLPFLLEFDKFSFTHMGEFPNMVWISNYRDFIYESIMQGNNPSDITISMDGTYIAFSIKYQKDQGNTETDVEKIEGYMRDRNVNYKIGLIIKDKKEVLNHKYNHDKNTTKKNIKQIDDNSLLFDLQDIEVAYAKFKKYILNLKTDDIEQIIEHMNIDILNSLRKLLHLKLHQGLAIEKFKRNIKKGLFKHLISFKPRSGKTLIMLMKAHYILETLGRKKVLIMTSVPDTIDSFISCLLYTSPSPRD